MDRAVTGGPLTPCLYTGAEAGVPSYLQEPCVFTVYEMESTGLEQQLGSWGETQRLAGKPEPLSCALTAVQTSVHAEAGRLEAEGVCFALITDSPPANALLGLRGA